MTLLVRSFTTRLPVGPHTIEVRTISQHYVGDPRRITVTVRGEGNYGLKCGAKFHEDLSGTCVKNILNTAIVLCCIGSLLR